MDIRKSDNNICRDRQLLDFRYTDDVFLPSGDASDLRLIYHHPDDGASVFPLHFADSKFKTMLQDCIGSESKTIFAQKDLSEADNFICFKNPSRSHWKNKLANNLDFNLH